MIKSNELSLSIKAQLDSDFSFIKETFYKITEIYLDNGKIFLDILKKIEKTQFNQWLKLEFPQQLLTIRKQLLVAQFLENHPTYETLIKTFDLEFLCILAKAPDSVVNQVLTTNRNNWSIAQLKQLITAYKVKLKKEKELKQKTDNQKSANKKLRQINKALKTQNEQYHKLVIDLQETNDQLQKTNDKLNRHNQLLYENNQILHSLINDISTYNYRAENSAVNKTPAIEIDYKNRTLFINRNMM